MTFQQSIDEIRIAARLAQYPNRHEEFENIERVDSEVWARVKVFEEGVVQAAQAHVAKHNRLRAEADELQVEIRQRVLDMADAREVDPAVAHDFERLRLRAEALAKSLDIAERSAQWHVGRCKDVYGSYAALVQRFPTLRPQIQVQ